MEKYTDQEFFYKQTPVNYDGIAKFTSIKGNTLGWNQLVENGNFADTSNWATGNATLSVSSNKATLTVTNNGTVPFYQTINQKTAEHKILVLFNAYASRSLNLTVNWGFQIGPTITLTTSNQRFSVLATVRTFGNNNFNLSAVAQTGDVINYSNVQLFDLTQMGLDSITADEFTSLFPLPYYSYNQGSLLSFNGNGIKTVGFNQWDEEWEHGSIGSNGENTGTSSSPEIRSKNYIPILPNTEYFLKTPAVTLIHYYGSADLDNYLGNRYLSGNAIITPPAGTNYVRFRTIGTYGDYKNDICLNISNPSRNGEYEPYTSSTLSLPISTYFPTGMKSAGTVYDELTPRKAITRIGAVDLGSLTWTKVGAISLFYATYNTDGVFHTGTELPNIKNNLYDVCSATTMYNNRNRIVTDDVITVNAPFLSSTEQRIVIADTSFTDATALKTALSGVYLYYELATETETDAEDIFYKFYADGTEQLLPVNGSSPETSPIIADIEYYDSTEGDSLYRRFWLINGDGERWDLTDKEFKSFLNNPTGLGFRKTIEVTRYGEKANKNNEVYDFPQPSGELLFYDTYNSTRYDKYNKFIRFLMSQPITLYYMIPVSYISGIANIFTLDCDVTEVQKTESKTDHILTSSIVFNGLGFYEGDEISINGTTDTYTLTNEGDFPVGFEITVEGSLTNPYVTLSQDGELYGEAKFDSETAFNSLYLNSNDGEQNIILQQGGSVIPNPLSYQDLSISNGSIYVTFVKLAKGVSELSIGVESGSITNVNIKYSPKYRSV